MDIISTEKKKKIIVETLNKLTDKELDLVFNLLSAKGYVKSNSQKTTICSTEKYLQKLNHDIPKNKSIVSLADLFNREWEIIAQNKILSNHFIRQLHLYKNGSSEELIAKRIKQDSSSGTYFENLFGNFLLSFLSSKKDLYFKNNKLKVKIVINSPIDIPGERNKKQPDILITNAETGVPTCIVELKTSYSHRSLKKEYAEQNSYWRKLNKDILFLYIIFNASSGKTKTFKQVPYCRVVCNDFNLMATKQIDPVIVDSIEKIYDEVYRNLTKRLNKK